jgi:hypothetical protein
MDVFFGFRHKVSINCCSAEYKNNYLHQVYNSNDKVEEEEIGRACNTHGEKRNAYTSLVGKSEG